MIIDGIMNSDAFFLYIYSLGVCKLKNLLIEIQYFNQENINQHIQLIMYKLVLNHICTLIHITIGYQ